MNSSDCNIDSFKHSVYPVVYLLIFILGLVGHSVSICVFFTLWRKKRSLTSINIIMVNLLVSDLMQVCSLPFRASYYLMSSRWHFGHVPCRLLFYVFYLNMYCSVYFLVSLNVMRYLALVRPYLFIQLQNCCSARVVCFCVWVFVALTTSPILFSKSSNQHSTKCLELPNDNATVQNLITVNNATLAVGFVIPLAVVLFCSIFVARRLMAPSPALGTVKASRKKACALVIISFIFFLICFLPYHVLRCVFLRAELNVLVSDACKTSRDLVVGLRKAAVVTHSLCTANSCLDPVLFFFVGEDFRMFFAKLVRRKKDEGSYAKGGQQRAELRVLQKSDGVEDS